jgi:hypothetical protein
VSPTGKIPSSPTRSNNARTDSSAAAQAVIFGMFGIETRPDGAVVIDPKPPSFSPWIKLTDVRIRGRRFDVSATASGYEVNVDGHLLRAKLGTPTLLR